MKPETLVVLCLLGTVSLAASSPVVLLSEGAASKFLKPSDRGNLTPSGLAATVTSMLGAKQPFSVGAHEAEQVESVLSNNAFSRPAAFSSVAVTGVTSLSPASVTPAGASTHSAEVSGSTEGVLSAMGQAAGAVAEAGSVTSMTLEECDDACVEGFLSRAVGVFGAEYAPGASPLTGKISFKGSKHADAELDLANEADKLWAVEVATLYGSADRTAASGPAGTAQMFESTLLGMQGLAAEYGAASPQFEAAWESLAAIIGSFQDSLTKAFNGEVVHSVALLGDATVDSGAVRHLLSWATEARRGLLQTATADVKDFTGMAAAIGVFLIILYFGAAGIFCLVNMDFKQDTLLYSGAKTD